MRCLLVLVPLVTLARAQCSLVSVSGCQPDPAEVILTLPLPSDQGAATCQQLCRDQEPCRYWSLDTFDTSTTVCSLLHAPYLATCTTVTAGPEPDYSECLRQNSGSCDDLVQENCDLLGTVLWQSEGVTHTYECQDYLGVLGPVYGGEVFSYSSLDHTCSILDTGARHCSAVSGPRQPSVEECQAATSTTADPTTTSPSSLDGAE